MSTRQDGAPAPTVRSRQDLVDWIAAGSKPASAWRIGTEHEKIVFRTDDHRPVPYEGPRGIRAILEALIARYGWEPIMEGDNIIALKWPHGESGGHRLARARRPVRALGRAAQRHPRDRRRRRKSHLDQVQRHRQGHCGIGFLGIGFSPNWTLDETPVHAEAALCR